MAAILLVLVWSVVSASAEPRISVEGAPTQLGGAIGAAAYEAHDICANWYGVEIHDPIRIEWVTEAGDLQRYDLGATGAVAGLADAARGRILLSSPALSRDPTRLRPVILHEMSHLVFARATRNAEVLPPRWLNEGIAMRVSGDWDLGLAGLDGHQRLLEDASAAGTLIPFADLDRGFPEGPFFRLAYAQSHSFVDWLVAQKGDDGVREFLAALDSDMDPEPAFRSVYGTTIEEAATEWHRELRPGGWLGRLPSAQTLFALIWGALGLLVVTKFVRTRIQLHRAADLDDGM